MTYKKCAEVSARRVYRHKIWAR